MAIENSQTRNQLMWLALMASVALLVVAWQVQGFIVSDHRARQGEMLATMLDSSHQAVNSWGRAHLATATIWANSQEMVAAARALLATPRERHALVNSPVQRELRERLQPLLDAMGYQGFFIIGPGDINLGSARNENIGVTNQLVGQGDILGRMWRSAAPLSLPRYLSDE